MKPQSVTAVSVPVSVVKPGTPVSVFEAPPFVPSFQALAAGVGVALLRAFPAARAAAVGVGSAVLRPAPVVRAAASGSGSVSTVASLYAFASGVGAVSAGANPVAAAAAGSVGTAAVQPAPVVRPMAAGAGTTTAPAAPRSTATGSGTGTTTANTIVFESSGIDKATPNQTTTLSTYTEITGWQERSTFSGSVYTTRGLVIPTGVTVNLVSRCTRDSTTAHSSMTHRLLANGVAIINGTTNANTTQADGTYTTTAETLITMESYTTNGSFDRLVVAAGVNTYITATRV